MYVCVCMCVSRFRSAVKELELMMQNLINTAFMTVRTVDNGIQLLDLFHQFSAREVLLLDTLRLHIRTHLFSYSYTFDLCI